MNGYDMIMRPLEVWMLGDIRSEIMGYAEKDVLEIGIGTGANCKYYDHSKISSFTALDNGTSVEFKECIPQKNVRFFSGTIENMPFADHSFDCVVATLILCTVNLEESIAEIKRILKPGGQFIFIEHVRPSSRLVGKLFDMMNSFWPKVANGCHLNRKTDVVLSQSGFSQIEIKQKCGGAFCYGIAKSAS